MLKYQVLEQLRGLVKMWMTTEQVNWEKNTFIECRKWFAILLCKHTMAYASIYISTYSSLD